jgi:hypothetical protein
MPIQYDSKKIIPAPFVSISKEYLRSTDSHKVGANFTLTANGKLFACKGSPMATGGFWEIGGYPPDSTPSNNEKFKIILNKQQAIRDLFSVNGKTFEIQPWDGSAPLKCYPIVKDIVFAQGEWVDYCDYTITLEAPELFMTANSGGDIINNSDCFATTSGTPMYLREASENWGFEITDEINSTANNKLFRLTHTLNAAGREVYNGDGYQGAGWQQAKKWVIQRTGIDNTILYGNIYKVPSSYGIYNHIVTENTDELGGTYGITESWLIASGNYSDEFEVSTRRSVDTALVSVNINGTIQGYGDDSSSKYNNADIAWSGLTNGYPICNIYNRALQYSHLGYLHSTPKTEVYGSRAVNGIITYTYEYDNRPSNYIANSLMENINISDDNATDVIAEIPVPGRAAGPVLQDLNTITKMARSVSINVLMPLYSGASPTTASNAVAMINASPKTEVNSILAAFYQNLLASYSQVYLSADRESWTPSNGSYSKSVTWIYQGCI